MKAVPELERGATPTHAYLGVGATDATPSGALVQTVKEDSPAAAAGVKTGDVIVAVGSAKITGVSELVAAIAAHDPGDEITLTILRGSKRLSFPLTLSRQPAQSTSG